MNIDRGKVAGLVAAAIGTLGTLKSVMEVGTGAEFGLQQVAFYVGMSGIAVYMGVAVGVVLGGLILGGIEVAGGSGGASEEVQNYVWIFGLTCGALFMAWVILQGHMFNYQDTDGFGRGAIALIGLGLLAASIYAWRVWSAEDGGVKS